MPDTTPTTPADETEEQRLDREQTERAHAEGEHAFCGVTCEATFPSDMLRNGILCRAVPGSAAMLDELLRRAARQVLGTTDQQPTADSPALAALRSIYTDMVTCRSGGDEWASEWLGEHWTTLPLDLRAAAGDTDAAEELGTTDQQPETLPEFELRGDTEIRAAALREAADEADRAGGLYAGRDDYNRAGAAFALMETYRRMADEAQQPETEAGEPEAWPTETEWIGEVLEVDAWMYLGASPDRSVAEKRRASVTRRHPDAQTRTVRKTTTYTVAADQSDTETEATPLPGPPCIPDHSLPVHCPGCADQPDTETEAAKCTYCGGSGVDPDDEGDWVPGVHRHDPGSRGPCPTCNGTGRTAP